MRLKTNSVSRERTAGRTSSSFQFKSAFPGPLFSAMRFLLPRPLRESTARTEKAASTPAEFDDMADEFRVSESSGFGRTGHPCIRGDVRVGIDLQDIGNPSGAEPNVYPGVIPTFHNSVGRQGYFLNFFFYPRRKRRRTAGNRIGKLLTAFDPFGGVATNLR